MSSIASRTAAADFQRARVGTQRSAQQILDLPKLLLDIGDTHRIAQCSLVCSARWKNRICHDITNTRDTNQIVGPSCLRAFAASVTNRHDARLLNQPEFAGGVHHFAGNGRRGARAVPGVFDDHGERNPARRRAAPYGANPANQECARPRRPLRCPSCRRSASRWPPEIRPVPDVTTSRM